MTRKKLILLIDDDPDIIESVKAILEAADFSVVTALSGEEGIKAYKTNKPDLVLCDMMMERIDAGFTVAVEICKEDHSVPVFLLSSIGNAAASNIEIDKLGFNGFFQKPVSPSDLVFAITEALRDI